MSYSEANMLYTIDGRSALSLYKEHLGADAAELPASALLFPLSMRAPGTSKTLVRVITSLAKALNLSAEALLAQAAGLDGEDEEHDAAHAADTETAIRNDAKLSEAQKDALLTVYRSFLAG